MATYGEIIVCDIKRSTLDTDAIILTLGKQGVVFDVTGWTAEITINVTKDGLTEPNVFEASGGVYGDPLNGQLEIDMSSFALAAGKYYHDIRIIDALSRGRESLAGSFTVTQRIEKAP